MPTHSTIDDITRIAKSLDALLTTIENPPSPAAVVAFKAAIRRHGHHLHDTAGPDGMTAVLQRVRDEASDRSQADERVAIVTEAWAGIAAPKDAAA